MRITRLTNHLGQEEYMMTALSRGTVLRCPHFEHYAAGGPRLFLVGGYDICTDERKLYPATPFGLAKLLLHAQFTWAKYRFWQLAAHLKAIRADLPQFTPPKLRNLTFPGLGIDPRRKNWSTNH